MTTPGAGIDLMAFLEMLVRPSELTTLDSVTYDRDEDGDEDFECCVLTFTLGGNLEPFERLPRKLPVRIEFWSSGVVKISAQTTLALDPKWHSLVEEIIVDIEDELGIATLRVPSQEDSKTTIEAFFYFPLPEHALREMHWSGIALSLRYGIDYCIEDLGHGINTIIRETSADDLDEADDD